MVEAAGILATQPRTPGEFQQAATDFGMSRTLPERHDRRARQTAGPAQAGLVRHGKLRQAEASLTHA
ncbi:hypothetical protein [Streptomyces sp. WELS2]|uniref:hypothetical protein n=1 Tax=Streptomyces sp. WELS2 TaxID=2749435 RepID=UPI0015F009E4|nr:hypothetical protein [Streptomyces sp. WELS2]